MHIVNVVDVESTCWLGDQKPEGEQSEIIEIGVAELLIGQSPSERKPKHGRYPVRPIESRISPFCTGLTGWTWEALFAEDSFDKVLVRFRKDFDTRERIWASWGDYDRRQFERQCSRRSLAYPFGRRHVNVKTLFALTLGLAEECSVEMAFDILGHKGIVPPGGHGFRGTPHRGVDDAINIARLFATVLIASRAGLGLPGSPLDHQGHHIHVPETP